MVAVTIGNESWSVSPEVAHLLKRNLDENEISIPTPLPRVEMIIIRDPDFATETEVYVNGELAEDFIEEHHIDPGAGYTREDWLDRDFSRCSPNVAERLVELYHEYADNEYIT